MNITVDTNGLISILKVLDTCIEMEANAAQGYQKLAHESQNEGPRALFAWLYNVEGTRLRRLTQRRRDILQQHPELLEEGLYTPRQVTGLTKLGWGRTWMGKSKVLDILRYAIDNEIRAAQFFRRKATTANEPSLKMMYNAAVAEHEDQVEYFGSQRQVLMQQQITEGANQLAELVV